MCEFNLRKINTGQHENSKKKQESENNKFTLKYTKYTFYVRLWFLGVTFLNMSKNDKNVDKKNQG